MVQVAVPSRERVEHYKILRDRVEREVGRINGEFGRVGVPAVHYLNQSFDRAEVAALYLAADVMAVTPLRDGMNLVAKEYIAGRVDNGGALVLSEFAGAAAELPEAYLINPHDLDGLKDTLVRALDATPAENRARMRAMRRHVRAHDVRAWARAYLKALRSPQSIDPWARGLAVALGFYPYSRVTRLCVTGRHVPDHGGTASHEQAVAGPLQVHPGHVPAAGGGDPGGQRLRLPGDRPGRSG